MIGVKFEGTERVTRIGMHNCDDMYSFILPSESPSSTFLLKQKMNKIF